jgi:exopolysaccharide production protein ExoQ
MTGPAAEPVYRAVGRTRRRSIDRLASTLGFTAERVFVVYTLFIMSSGGLTPYPPPTLGPAIPLDSGSLTDSIFSLLYLILAILVALRPGRVVKVAVSQPWVLALLGVAAASTTWSTVPDDTMRRSIAIIATSVFGWYVISRYGVRGFLQMLAISLGVTVFLSIVYGVLRPGLVSVAQDGGAWRGVYENKNVFARAMVLSSITFLLLGIDPGARRWLVWAGAALSIAMVLLSRSGTGLVVLILLVVLLKFSSSLRLRFRVLVPVLIICGLLAVGGVIWLGIHADVVAGGMGKDTTLTGRTDLWSMALAMIERRPWLGYGYGGFWRGAVGESGYLWLAVGWEPPHSHNGFLDLALDLGIVGLLAFLLALLSALYRATLRARSARSAEAVGPLVLLVFLILYNLTESAILKHNDIFWVIFVVASAGASLPPIGREGREILTTVMPARPRKRPRRWVR